MTPKITLEILVLFLNFSNSVGISFLIDVLTSKRFSIFWSFFLRTGPRECHIRIPREKLNSIHKFSARLVPWQPISWAIHVFAHFWSFFRRIGPRECHNRILRFKLYRVHQFSSKLAPGEPVSWPDHVFLCFVVSNMSRTFEQTTLPTEILVSYLRNGAGASYSFLICCFLNARGGLFFVMKNMVSIWKI